MIEVLKQALEALNNFADGVHYDGEYDEIGSHDCCGALSYNPHSESCKATKAIASINQAIAELESQEPVAWMDADGNVSDNNDHKCFPMPLYTYPPQRTEERNFCPRCGKRTADLTVIHTCTPPQIKTTDKFESARVEDYNRGWNDCLFASGIVKQSQRTDPPDWFSAVENILNEYGLQAIDFVADFKAAMKDAEQSPRTWVGLTDEEIDSYFEDHGWSPSEYYYPVIKDIEAKLKERNG
jgi:hypothetical protein